MPLTAVIVAAGAGTRLGELGKLYSKPTVPMAGQPLLHWVVTMLRTAGVERLVVVGHPSDTRLAELVRQQPNAQLVLQAERKGIADALRQALPLLSGDEAYLACACDSLYRVAEVRTLIETGQANPGAAVVGVLDMGTEATAVRSAVRIEAGRVVDIIEKPRPGTFDSGYVALPLYWLPRAFADFCREPARDGAEHFISTALNDFLHSGGCVQAVAMSSRLEITTAADIAAAESIRRDSADWFVV